MQTTLTDIPTGDALPMLNAYKYDQLNRLLEAGSYETGLSSNVWNPSSYGDEYLNTFTYDANGNILTQNRHLRDGTQTDELTYNYLLIGGNLVRNRLYHVNDAIAGATYVGDLEDQDAIDNTSVYNFETNNNYRYDEEGRLIRDRQEGIEEIVWRVDGKVKKVIFTSGKNNLEFDYDAFGRRIAKHVLTQGNVLVKSTYYILDAQGNQLSTYEHVLEDEESNYELAERVIYGSSRLGINVNKVDLFGNSEEDYLNLTLGNKLFEMSNHLGNVLTVINDIKVPYLDGSDVAYYATIVSTADYSPFGVQLDGRTVSAELYKYGYQGSEKDDEIKGGGNSYTTEFRMLDPRLGRWLSIDPLAGKFPWQSPYVSMDNKPIRIVDILGLEGDDGDSDEPYYIKMNTTHQGPYEEQKILPQTAEDLTEVVFLYEPIMQGNTPYKGSIVQVKYVYNLYPDDGDDETIDWNAGRWIRTEMISYSNKRKADGEFGVFGQGAGPLESLAGRPTTIPNAGIQGSGFSSFEAFVSSHEITQPFVLEDGTVMRPPIVPPSYDVVRIYFNPAITNEAEVLSSLRSRGISTSNVIFYSNPFDFTTGLPDPSSTSDFILDFANISR